MLRHPARVALRRIPLSPTLTTVRHEHGVPATVVDRGFWRSLIPKPMRKENRLPRTKSKEWNPATFFIVMFLLIGSMSIQMIAMRNAFTRYMRLSEARIATLKEVVEKIQKGETVDVEKALGTGDPEKEQGQWRAKGFQEEQTPGARTRSSEAA
ncbi:uncharacterized protein F5Z01DRAFT_676742 [Emericellopsis atlantica]|uniref:Uncharacterized protein n=1 Tax=Emericellopsis atlantica TaxID=2614577 RepID=A0A9P8CNB8_9HYPO|nr:uncharacterized protein F5Z01DRAFT_676742 [Emericellopsis atlantica]KAG9251551.1 hypothetical protein F5Z01DRAFT_676742 [Emericellopsis atlantica]